MAFSVRGLTQGVMGGITALRRGALQGREQNREMAMAEQARTRQTEQDKQLALYRQLEQRLAERRQAAGEEQFKAEGPSREARTAADLALARMRDKGQRRPTRVISEGGRQVLVYADTGEPVAEFGPRPRGGGGSSLTAGDRQYQQIVAEARAALARHDRRMGGGTAGDRTYRRAVQSDPTRQRTEETEINRVINDRFRRGELTSAERDRLLGGPAPPYGPRP